MSHSIEFKFLAPYNKGAVLIGSFSDWKEIPMQKDDKGYFRARVDLEDGVYQYKFRVQSKSWFLEPDEWVEINDPYVTLIDAKTGNGVVRIEKGQQIIDKYVWKHDDKPLPSNRELIVYEMHVGDFSGGEDDPNPRGQYRHVIEKLDYLCELGVNAIELMPLYECLEDYSWGYLPCYYFATHPNYGSTEDLKRLIDECHARGIRVIMDQVYNHSSEECPLMKIDRDYWYYHDRHHPDSKPEDYWGPEFNYEHYDENLGIKPAWQFIGDVVRFLIQEYHIDGIRYDAIKLIDNYDFMYWIIEEAAKAAGGKPFYNIGECVPEKTDLVCPAGPMDAVWHDSFSHCLNPLLWGEEFDLEEIKNVLDGKRQGYPGEMTRVINYLKSHDHDHLLAELGDRGIFGEEAFKRVKLGTVLLMTAVGVPMILMGEEFGEYKHKAPNQERKIDWSVLKNDSNQNLLAHWKGVIALRKQIPALLTDNIEFFHSDADNKVLGYVRWNDEGSQVVIVANLSNQSLMGYQVPNFPNGTLRNWLSDDEVEASDNQLTVDLAEWEAKIFVTEQRPRAAQKRGDRQMASVR